MPTPLGWAEWDAEVSLYWPQAGRQRRRRSVWTFWRIRRWTSRLHMARICYSPDFVSPLPLGWVAQSLNARQGPRYTGPFAI